jgi:hypothetical protein
MKRDIKDFVSQKRGCKYNKLQGLADARNADLFMMYANERFQIKFEQSKYGDHSLLDNF